MTNNHADKGEYSILFLLDLTAASNDCAAAEADAFSFTIVASDKAACRFRVFQIFMIVGRDMQTHTKCVCICIFLLRTASVTWKS